MYRVAVVYAVVAFVLVQAAGYLFPALLFPPWAHRLLVVLALFGFPVALVLAWALELTPEGVQRAPPASAAGGGTGEEAGAPGSRSGFTTRALIGIVALGLGGWVVVRSLGDQGAGPGPVESIAVLPFEDMSPEGNQEHLGHGIAEEIRDALSRVEGLRVASRTSAVHLTESGLGLREIGRRLNVEAVLEGSVRKSGDSLRITAQLIDAGTNFHLYSDRFDRRTGDIFAVQEGIARSVVDALGLALPAEGRARLVAADTERPEAYELYLQGRLLWAKRTAGSMRASIEFFRRAIEADSGYARAYAGLADAYTMLDLYGFPAGEGWRVEARRLVERALELDVTLGEAHSTLGLLATSEGDWRSALRHHRTAAALNPRYAYAHHWVSGNMLAGYGSPEDALPAAARAYELDPVSLVPVRWYAFVLRCVGEYERSVEIYERNARLHSELAGPHTDLAEAYSIVGRHEDAVRSARRAIEIEPDSPVGHAALAEALAVSGDREGALEALARARAREAPDWPPWRTAFTYAFLGDLDRAFALFEGWDWEFNKYTQWVRCPLDRDPRLEALRADPRFPDLRARVTEALDLE